MRLKKEVVAEREQFVKDAVKADPTLTGVKLQELLQGKFGAKMRVNRLYDLKNEALAELKGGASVPTVSTVEVPASTVLVG